MRRDSPVEWTGRAHIVTVSCHDCGDTVEVPEEDARHADEHGQPIRCDGCGSGGPK
jgi:predicted RNA-binding Zn-ribbon protein involved in translation (DUF1610 family)